MHRLVAWVQASAVALGGPGLFLIAFLDSSFLSFPEVVDLLIIWLVTAHKERMLYYALLPPPVPFKPFVLAAGVAGVRPVDFLIAVGAGRGVRYFGEALLAVWYGE